MNTEGHRVTWQDAVYFLSELTVGVKDDFCRWLVETMIGNIRRFRPSTRWASSEKLIWANPPEWTTTASDEVIAAFNTDPGVLQLNRLLFGLTPDEMTDEELKKLILTKKADPMSDYSVAMSLIQETADPKARKGSLGSTDPTPTAPAAPRSTPTAATATSA